MKLGGLRDMPQDRRCKIRSCENSNLPQFLTVSPLVLAFHALKAFHKQNVYWIHKVKFLL
jgi:hypothetical protein